MSKLVAPAVRFFGPTKSARFIGEDADEWRRIQPGEEARLGTGFDLETAEPELGIGITRRGADTFELSFDLIRLGLKLKSEVVERLREKWHAQLSPKTPQRLRARGRFSASFALFPTRSERVDEWKVFLETTLSDSASYQPSTQTRQRRKEIESHTADSL
jgi:hypothetical protein